MEESDDSFASDSENSTLANESEVGEQQTYQDLKQCHSKQSNSHAEWKLDEAHGIASWVETVSEAASSRPRAPGHELRAP